MDAVEKKYIVDEKNRKIAVQIDIDTYVKIEEVLENYGLMQLIKEHENDELFDIENAKNFYKTLVK